MELYLAPYTGAGTRKNPFRAVGADEPGCGSIDLRPDPTKVDGYALVSRPSPLPTLATEKIGDDFKSTFGVTIRNRLQTRMGVDLTGVNRFDTLVGKLLMEPPANGWNPLRPVGKRNPRYEAMLGGQLVWTAPYISGGATDSFTYSDGLLPTVSGGLWANDADSGSTLVVTSGTVSITTEDLQTINTYVGAASTADHYSQCINPSDGFTAGGPAVRCGGGTGFCCYMYWPAFDQISKYVDNTFTLIGGALTPSYNAGETMRIEAQGTSIRVKINGSQLTGSPVTDSSLTVAGEGVGIIMDEAASVVDTWEGADLVALPIDIESSVESIRTDTSDPYTFDFTPGQQPQGIVLTAVHGTSSTDHISAVTCDGVSMTRVVRATDTVTEAGASEIWFLGSGVPSGTLTFSIDLTSATGDDFHFVGISLITDTASNVEVIDSDSISENATDPSVTLQYGGRNAVAVGALYGGGAAPSSFTPNGNCSTVQDHDLGAFYSEVIRQTTPGTSDFAIGGTAVADDVAYVAAAFSKVATGKAPVFNPRPHQHLRSR